MGDPAASRFKSLLRVAINGMKDSVAFAKRARIRRATALRLEWAIARLEPEPQTAPIDLTTPS